jgi:hypothetical protein
MSNNMNYRLKEITMCQVLENYQAPANFRSSYKAVPISLYEELKRFIDFTKYYVCFRGPRFNGSYSTRKRDAYAFDVYQRSDRDTREIRIERDAFNRGVRWANNRSH